MTWIESHIELGRHPKALKLARMLQVPLPQAIGHLHMLWWWAVDFAEDGDLSKYDDSDIAAACQFNLEPAVLKQALIDSGFLDVGDTGSLYIHQWPEYTGKLIEGRKKHAERMKSARSKGVTGTCVSREEHKPACAPDTMTSTSTIHVPDSVSEDTCPNTEKPKEEKPPNPEIAELFAYYQQKIQPKARIYNASKIAARLKKYELWELLKAIDNFSEDTWWMENNAARGADWFFHSDTRIEGFLNMEPRKERNNGSHGTNKPAGVDPNSHVARGTFAAFERT